MAANLCIVTLGTRDLQLIKSKTTVRVQKEEKFDRHFVQLPLNDGLEVEVRYNKDFPDHYSLASPRECGGIIAKMLADPAANDFWDVVQFPILDEFIQTYLINDSELITVYTDQNDGAPEHRKNDTLYFNELLTPYIKRRFPERNIGFREICFHQDVVNIDALYRKLNEENNLLSGFKPEDFEHIYLFMQGGIDQINMALTLRLIEQYRGKVRQIQKPERGNITERHFPALFLRRLNREKIIDRLNKYDFAAITDYLDSSEKTLHGIARYVHLRGSRNHKTLIQENELASIVQTLIKKPENRISTSAKADLDFGKLGDLYLDAKIDLIIHRRIDDFATKIQTCCENYFRIKVNSHTARRGICFEDFFEKGLVVKSDELLESLKKYSINLNGTKHIKHENSGNKTVNIPFITLYGIIYEQLEKTSAIKLNPQEKNRIKKFKELVSNPKTGLIRLRNPLIHSTGNITESDLETILKEHNYNTEIDLFNELDQIFEVSNFGYLDDLKAAALIELNKE